MLLTYCVREPPFTVRSSSAILTAYRLLRRYEFSML